MYLPENREGAKGWKKKIEISLEEINNKLAIIIANTDKEMPFN